MKNEELIKEAKKVAKVKRTKYDGVFGEVGSALITDKGNVYTGISLNLACGIGFCAEHSAIAEMAKHREYLIKKIVAVSAGGKVLPPCGRCRELMYQVNEKNLNTNVIIGKNKIMKLKELLPEIWQKKFYK